MNSSSHGSAQSGSARRDALSRAPALDSFSGGAAGDREGYAAPRVEDERPLSRRSVVAWGLGASTGLAITGVFTPGAWARSVVTGRRVVWGLDPARRDGSGCRGCHACRRHADNKLFRSAHAARVGRAHPHCNCAVVRAGSLAPATWRALFVRRDGTRRASVDRRTPKVQRLLKPRAARRVG